MNKFELEQLILSIKDVSKIKSYILEKDYYVCLILKELSKKQDELKAYFKGGIAIYKILDTMNRFSEDIDLTVKVIETESKTSNVKRLKKSALDYEIEGLTLLKEENIDKKGSIISFYKYDSLFDSEALFKSEKIQIEATSFTVSEPIKKYTIEPLIYKYATAYEKNILKEKYDVCPFIIDIIKLERIFIDKIFATEFYYIRKMYSDVSKHLYDITVLFENEDIINLLKDKNEIKKLISYKRKEEKVRIGGIEENLKIKDFSYLNEELNSDLIKVFDNMQKIYVLDDTYKYSIDLVIKTIDKLKLIFNELDI